MQVFLNHNIAPVQIIIDTKHFVDADIVYNLKRDAGITGNEDAIAAFWRELEDQTGAFGHLITPEAVSNADLSAAVRKLPSFTLVKILDEPKLTTIPVNRVT